MALRSDEDPLGDVVGDLVELATEAAEEKEELAAVAARVLATHIGGLELRSGLRWLTSLKSRLCMSKVVARTCPMRDV
jgi:hypothetical protein